MKFFKKIYPLRYTQKKVVFWGPCLAKKFDLSLYGEKKPTLGPLKIKKNLRRFKSTKVPYIQFSIITTSYLPGIILCL